MILMNNRNKVQDNSNQTKEPFKYGPEELSDLMESNSLSTLNNDYGGVHSIIEALRTSHTSGLCESDENPFHQRRALFGVNTYPLPPAKSIIVMFIENLNDLSLIILMVFSVVSIALGLAFPDTPNDRKYGWIEGFAILMAVVIVSGVSSINDWNKERKFRSLNKESKKILISVTREDKTTEVLIDEIMVGEIVHLRTGDQVPADGLYITGFDLKTDESAVTGETDLIKKTKDSPFLRSGTQVAEGGCDMVIVAVGPYSQWGKALTMIAKGKMDESPEEKKELTKEEKRRKEEAESGETPLEMKLNGLATSIGKLGIIAGVLTTGVLIIGWAVRKVIDVNHGDQEWSKKDAIQLVNFIVIGVTIVVVAIPEGLPLAVTISLAYSVREMLLDNNLVRHLAACETMGGATNICSDKTGTLTLNQMNVVQGYFGGKDYKDAIPQLLTNLKTKTIDLLIEGVIVNSKVNVMMNDVEKEEKPKTEFQKKIHTLGVKLGIVRQPKVRKSNPEDRWKVVGSKTEGALVLMLIKHFNKNLEYPEQELKRMEANHSIAHQFSFSSKKKRMSTVIRLDHLFDPKNPHIPDVTRLDTFNYKFYSKGASELLLEDCSYYLTESGEPEAIDEKKKRELINCIDTMANQGLRTLCLAYKDFSRVYHPRADLKHHDFSMGDGDSLDGYIEDPREREYFESIDEGELGKKMTMIAIVGIKDPVREEVPAAVSTCKKAGIIVRMVTGDNILTAKHIARECGILSTDGIAIEGPVFRKMNDDEIKKILPRLQVMARSSPADKYRLVTKLRELGEVVAVTGDGTNDGPALKAADVGLAMGLSGTQVAKEASDIIILDDNFDSIVQSVKWGRCVFENIRRFLLFQVTVNIVALVLTVITAITTFIIGKREEGTGIIRYEPPLTAIQLLWVNLIMDTFAALALATEKPTDDLLLRKPHGRTESLISKKMWVFMGVQSFYQLLVLLLEYYIAERIGIFKWEQDPHRIEGLNRTLVFNTFVFLQFFNQFNARKINFEFNILSGILKSPWFLVISVITLALQVVFVNVEGKFTQTMRLDWHHWLISLGLAFLCIPIGLVTRIVARFVLYVVQRRKETGYQPQEDSDKTETDPEEPKETSEPTKNKSYEVIFIHQQPRSTSEKKLENYHL